MHQTRIANVVKKMNERTVPQLIVSDPAAIFYLTGMWIHPGERLLALIIKESGENLLVVNKLFPLPKTSGVALLYYDDTEDGVALLAENMIGSQRIGVDKTWPAHFLLRLMALVATQDFINGSLIIDELRGRKSVAEIRLLREASQDNDTAMGRLQALLPEQLSEVAMAKKLAGIYEELGNTSFSFEPIVAYGANGADPHHGTDQTVVKKGDSIILDIGGVKADYCSDMTRTVFYQAVSDKKREVYEIVLEANRRAIAAVRPGIPFSAIDAAARDYITEKGYGDYFTHRTGHFIGIECHEAGDVSGANQTLVEAGMVFSIEPGIYLQGEVGVRIEDLVVATADGCEVLNNYPKELKIVG